MNEHIQEKEYVLVIKETMESICGMQTHLHLLYIIIPKTIEKV